jgi:hypothetical protein
MPWIFEPRPAGVKDPIVKDEHKKGELLDVTSFKPTDNRLEDMSVIKLVGLSSHYGTITLLLRGEVRHARAYPNMGIEGRLHFPLVMNSTTLNGLGIRYATWKEPVSTGASTGSIEKAPLKRTREDGASECERSVATKMDPIREHSGGADEDKALDAIETAVFGLEQVAQSFLSLETSKGRQIHDRRGHAAVMKNVQTFVQSLNERKLKLMSDKIGVREARVAEAEARVAERERKLACDQLKCSRSCPG